MTRRFLIAAALLVAAGIAQAQPLPPGKWWRRAEVVQTLQLTADQQEKLDDIFRAAADSLIDAKGEVEKLQIALRGEIDRSTLRRAEIQRIVSALNVARGKLFERELMMLVDMRGVLNETQWNRLRQHLDRMQEQRGDGPGPNGPNRPRNPGQRPPNGGGRRP